jgi:MerR family transcriptional regulator, copper efflux regulator
MGWTGRDRGAAGDRPPRGPAHRQFGGDDLAIAALALELERRLDVSPAELAFGIKVLAEPAVRAEVAGLARRLGRIPPLPGRALDFEQERALRLLGRPTPPGPGRPAPRAAP